jgi:hypothetical protein
LIHCRQQARSEGKKKRGNRKEKKNYGIKRKRLCGRLGMRKDKDELDVVVGPSMEDKSTAADTSIKRRMGALKKRRRSRSG